MKEALAFIGIVALAAALWFLKGYSDSQIIDAKDATILSLKDTAQLKDQVISKQNALIESGTTTIKLLQAQLQSKDDLLGKDQTLLSAKDESIASQKETLEAEDTALQRDTDLIAALQIQVRRPPFFVDSPIIQTPLIRPDKTVDKNQYVKDNGFDLQDLGSGFSAYQIFGIIRTTRPNELPAPVSNRTPWKFGSANSGIVANGSSYYVTGASNHDSDGTTSTNGQAGLMEYEGSSISQMVDLPAGTYTVSFDYEGRRDYLPADRLAVSLGEKVLFTGAPTTCNNFTNVITKSVTFTKPGSHELKFLGLGNGTSVYPATFIDNVVITPTTESDDQTAAKKLQSPAQVSANP